jgi:hypothetical protein
VEQEPLQSELFTEEAVVASLTVNYVADDRVTDMGHVAPDLVSAACGWPGQYQRVSGSSVAADWNGKLGSCKTFKRRHGRDCRAAGDIVIVEWGVDIAGIGGESPNDSEVLLAERMGGEGLTQQRCGLGIEGEENYSRGTSIQTVERIDPAVQLMS